MQGFITFLGQLGIDLNLLVAQIVNFIILLWVLNRFIYKPLVQKIESDEIELQKAKVDQDKLAKEKIAFTEKQRTEKIKTRDESRKLIIDAEKTAQEIKQSAKSDAEKQAAEMLSQMKKQLSSKKAGLQNEQLQTTKEKMLQNSVSVFQKIAGSPQLQNAIMQFFLNDLISKIGLFPAATFQGKNPKIIIESPSAPAPDQLEKIREVLNGKFQQPVEISAQNDPNLISGYRLEINGEAVESNLYNELVNGL